MSALGVLMQATLGGEPLALWALNTIGMAVGLNLNLNYEPTISFKGASLSGSGADVARFTSGVSIPKALLAVVVPAVASFVEPFWLITDGEHSLDFGSCELSGSFSSGSSSSGLGGSDPGNDFQDTSTGHGGRGNRPLDTPRDHQDDEISGDSQHNGGDDGNGDDRNNNPDLTPPPTNSMQGAPDTSSPPRPIAGGAPPPPPPPPPPGLGALWDENMDNLNTESFIQISMIILAGLFLQTLFDAMHKVLKSFSWYTASLKAFASFARRMRRAAKLRYMRSVLSSGYKNSGKMRSVSFSVHKSVSRAAIKDKIIVEDALKMKSVAGKLKLRERPFSVKHVADESVVFISAPVGPLADEPLVDMFVKPTSARDSVRVVLFKAFVDMIFRIHGLVHGFFALSYTPTLFFVTVMGLFAYYHMLIQAVGIVHLGPAVDAEKFLASLEARRNAKQPVVESVPVKVEGSITESVAKDDDMLEGIYSSMHSPVHPIEDSSPSTSAEPAQQVIEHQGGVPITDLEFRQGYRTRRRTRCRKKKGSSSEVAPVAVESSPLFVDEDSRSLSSSIWAA